jgi:very-short-patch-repair endonuclease
MSLRLSEADYQALVAASQRPHKRALRGLDAPISPPPSLTPTDAAKRLLQAILDAKLPGLWCREYTFHAQRDWRLDVACPQDKIGIEVDGGVHRIKKRFLGDMEKSNALIFAGWSVLRVTPAQVDSGFALDLLTAFLHEDSDAP